MSMLDLQQYAQDLAALRKTLVEAGEALHIENLRETLEELTEEMNQPEFWNDTDRANKINQKVGSIRNKLEHYEGLLSMADDIEVAMEMAEEEQDEAMVAEAGEMLAQLREQTAALELESKGIKADVVVVDPPRKGLNADTIEALHRMNPRRIVYVSCDPATLARDVALLKERGYRLTSAQAADLFPRCAHVESIVCLCRQ